MAKRKLPFQYFLGGAFWSEDDVYPDFIATGRWETGSDEYTKKCLQKLEVMRPGDRFAIKKKLGKGSNKIQIRAIGIIKSIDLVRGIVYINWVRTGMKRKVDCKNVFATLHGPYSNKPSDKNADWINQIFCL